MKKIIAILLTVTLISVVLVSVVISAHFNSAEKNTAVISIPGLPSVKATFTESKTNARGEIIKYYYDDSGNEYVLNSAGEIRGATFRNNRSTSVSANKNRNFTEDEIRDIAEQFVALLTDNDNSFKETLYNPVGNGSTALYNFVFNQFIEGFKTENSIYVCYNAAGKILDFACINDIDYSKLDTSALAKISDKSLNSFASARLNDVVSGALKNFEITDTYIIESNGKYSICAQVDYSADTVIDGVVSENISNTEIYYEIN